MDVIFKTPACEIGCVCSFTSLENRSLSFGSHRVPAGEEMRNRTRFRAEQLSEPPESFADQEIRRSNRGKE